MYVRSNIQTPGTGEHSGHEQKLGDDALDSCRVGDGNGNHSRVLVDLIVTSGGLGGHPSGPWLAEVVTARSLQP